GGAGAVWRGTAGVLRHRRGGRAAGGLRALVLQLFDLPRTARDLSGGPVRGPGGAGPGRGQGAAAAPGAAVPGRGAGAAGMGGAGLERAVDRLLRLAGGERADRLDRPPPDGRAAEGAGGRIGAAAGRGP